MHPEIDINVPNILPGMRHTLTLIVTAPNEEEGLNASSVVVVGKENTRKPGNEGRSVTLDDGVRKRRRLI